MIGDIVTVLLIGVGIILACGAAFAAALRV
jgi:hypothetical protein